MATHLIPYRVKDIRGKRYGRLVVVAYAGHVGGRQATYWHCVCDCGKMHTTNGPDMKRGNTKSCGCYSKEVARNKCLNLKTHGMTKHPLYTAWKNMRQRCSNPNSKDYHRYGGRGIKVCKRWDDFAVFVSDIGARPKGMTLDRINSDGDYEPSNCRWADVKTQRRNSCQRKDITYLGKTMRQIEWADRIGLTCDALSMRLKRGWSLKDALTKQKGEKRCA